MSSSSSFFPFSSCFAVENMKNMKNIEKMKVVENQASKSR